MPSKGFRFTKALLRVLPFVALVLLLGQAASHVAWAGQVDLLADDQRLSVTPSGWQIAISLTMIAVVVALLRLSQRWPATMRPNVIVVLSIGAWYLWWRFQHTLVTEPLVPSLFSLILFVAESYGYVTVIFYYIQTWNPLYRAAPPPMTPDELPTVDLFVTIFDEPTDVLYRTLVGCRAIKYPKGKLKIYVLDDGRRSAVREPQTEAHGGELW